MTKIRKKLAQKLDKLSTEQLNSVLLFVDSLDARSYDEETSSGSHHFREYKQKPVETETPVTNEDIDRIVESYHQQNKPLPIGLAKGEFDVSDDFNDPLPNEILDLFQP